MLKKVKRTCSAIRYSRVVCVSNFFETELVVSYKPFLINPWLVHMTVSRILHVSVPLQGKIDWGFLTIVLYSYLKTYQDFVWILMYKISAASSLSWTISNLSRTKIYIVQADGQGNRFWQGKQKSKKSEMRNLVKKKKEFN